MMSMADPQYWHWLTLGIVLLVVDLLLIGTSFLMWIGLAALATGAITFLLPVGWLGQVLLFSGLSVASVLLWKRYVKEAPTPAAAQLNQRGAAYIGQVVHLEEAIVGGHGRIRLDDTLWFVAGPDAPAGTPVTILAQDGNGFRVDVTKK